MAKMKAVFGLWADLRVSDLNRILKPHGVRLVAKGSKEWGERISITAHPLVEVVRVAPAAPSATPSAPPATSSGADAG